MRRKERERTGRLEARIKELEAELEKLKTPPAPPKRGKPRKAKENDE